MANVFGTPRALPGAHRDRNSPRLHSVSRPYSRPTDASPVANGSAHPAFATRRQSPTRTRTTRAATLATSQQLPRSGSEGSLFSGIKSLFSRPLQWLATPTRVPATQAPGGAKRNASPFGDDLDDLIPSPSERRAAKRARRSSPDRERNPYEPGPPPTRDSLLRTARSSDAFALPSLPPNVSLTARPGRPSLPASTSMPYLDPPTALLAPSSPRGGGLRRSGTISGAGARSTGGPLTRSRRLDLASLADEQEEEPQHLPPPPARGIVRSSTVSTRLDTDSWSPWKDRTYPAAGRASIGGASRPDARDVVLQSNSPFRARASPAPAPAPRSSLLGRSATMTSLARESSIGASETGSIDHASSLRGNSLRPRASLRPSSSMQFSASDLQDLDEDDRSSVGDGWGAPRRSTLLPSSTSSRRLSAFPSLGSTASTSTLPAIRKGNMVWDGDRGFVRESELNPDVPKPALKNDAERILFALESSRGARNDQSANGLPASLIGASSRQLRKAIAVPLVTAEAESKAKRRAAASNWVVDDKSLISPYGRRRAIDTAARERRRDERRAEQEAAASEVSDMEVDNASQRSSRRSSRSTSYVSDDAMSVSSAASSNAPRRSARNKVRSRSPIPEEDEEMNETPKVRRSTRTKKNVKSPTPEPTPRATRSTRRKKTSPLPERKSTPSPPPTPVAVPAIITHAASPSASTSGSAAPAALSSGYQVRDDNDGPRARSSLRAGAERKHRSHQGAASYNSSRATTPAATGSSGRFSAREEDLPDMEELEAAAKIPLSFSGISMPLFGNTTPPVDKPKAPEPTPSTNHTPLLSSRIGTPAPASSQQPANSLSLPSSNTSRSINRLGTGISTRPRASSPLANNSVVAEPDSPQSQKGAPAISNATPKEPPADAGFFSLSAHTPVASLTPTGSTTPASKPPASSFFAAPTSPKPAASLGLGKPPSPDPSSGVPNFFGQSGSATPVITPSVSAAPIAFDFGIKPKTAEQSKPVVSTFSFGSSPSSTPAPAAKSDAPAPSALGQPADKPAFSFGNSTPAADKPAEGPTAPFSFGTPAASTEASKPVAAPKAPFSFGAPSTTPAAEPKTAAPFSFGAPASAKPAEPAKSTGFSFGTPSAAPPAADKSTEAPKPFSFGTPAATPAAVDKPVEAPKPFGFGAPAAEKPASSFGGFGTANGSAAKPAAPGPSTSSFGTGTGFGFGKAKSPEKESSPAPSTGFGFGSAAPADKPAFSFGSNSATTAPAAPASTGFGFGAPAASTPAAAPSSTGFGSGTGFSFGSSAPASTGFGSTPAAPATAPASSGFSFGASNNASSGFGSTAPAATPASTGNGFGSSSGFGAGSGFGGGANGAAFGSTPAAPSATPFAFGSSAPSPAPGASPATPTGPSFAFGAPNNAATTAAAPAAAPFSFGSSTSSAAPASQPFQFGAAPTTPTSAPVRFGSPAPASADGNGFSMGLGADNAPGSPGGRKIKPLRRGAVKR